MSEQVSASGPEPSRARDVGGRDVGGRDVGGRDVGDDITALLAVAIRRGRAATGQSQRALARVCGVAPSTIARMETAAQDVPIRLAGEVLAALGMSLAVLDTDGCPLTATDLSLEADRRRAAFINGRRLPAHLPHRPDAVQTWTETRDRQAGRPWRRPERHSWAYRQVTASRDRPESG